MIRVVWDDKNAEAHWRKHGVRFEDAKYVFSDPYSFTEHNCTKNDEERWQTIGLGANYLLLFVVHTSTEENNVEIIRIISARNVTSKEEKRYGNRKLQLR